MFEHKATEKFDFDEYIEYYIKVKQEKKLQFTQ